MFLNSWKLAPNNSLKSGNKSNLWRWGEHGDHEGRKGWSRAQQRSDGLEEGRWRWERAGRVRAGFRKLAEQNRVRLLIPAYGLAHSPVTPQVPSQLHYDVWTRLTTCTFSSLGTQAHRLWREHRRPAHMATWKGRTGQRAWVMGPWEHRGLSWDWLPLLLLNMLSVKFNKWKKNPRTSPEISTLSLGTLNLIGYTDLKWIFHFLLQEMGGLMLLVNDVYCE